MSKGTRTLHVVLLASKRHDHFPFFKFKLEKKDRDIFLIFWKNMSNIPIGNGTPFKALIIKPTTTLLNIAIIYYTLLFV
jgi:hypothetical protein